MSTAWLRVTAVLFAFQVSAFAGGFICDEDGDGVPDEQDVCCGTPDGIPVDAFGRPIGDLDGDCDVDLFDYWLFQQSFTGPLPPCPPECFSNAECPTGEYCQPGLGDCNGPGVCAPQPGVCPLYFDPVCGCDGTTYSNPCFAAMAGVGIAYQGPCVTTCNSNNECLPTEYCAAGAGNCGAPGECAPRPQVCIQVYLPVCGCDGNTYGNACFAAQAGVNVDHEGACAPPGCTSNGECDPEEYCQKDAGDCDGSGTCVARPDICAAVYDPVCGCDGQTYSNSCVAAAVGVNEAHKGECLDSCARDLDCEADEYCMLDVCQGVSGVCAVKPAVCPLYYDPVCGCDGQTYGNPCFAASAGVTVDHVGPCVSSCTSNPDCAAVGPDHYCAHGTGDCNGPGECQPKPQACPRVFDPVCGCDGNTYGNACEATAAGVSVAQVGACPPPVCQSNAECGVQNYCVKPEGACVSPGLCQAMPDLCVQVYDPVCGCDGQTYGNACFAAVAGVSVDHQGECCE